MFFTIREPFEYSFRKGTFKWADFLNCYNINYHWIKEISSSFQMSKNDQIALLRSELTAHKRLQFWKSDFMTFNLSLRWKPLFVLCRAGVPNLHDIMPDVLRWSWCNNNRNEVHKKYKVLESAGNCLSPTPPPVLPHPAPVPGKILFRETSPWCQNLWAPLL